MTKDIQLLLARHATLEAVHGDGEAGYFLSGWQSRNPWISQISERIDEIREKIDPSNYCYMEDDKDLKNGYLDLQEELDGVRPQDVFCGCGPTSFIFSAAAWLRENGHSQVYYISPLYYSIHFALKMFGIRSRPINGRHGYDDGFSINLPNHKTVLFLSDPIWYAGKYLPGNVVSDIATWQRDTDSLVVIDGSFQYMKWARFPRKEQTSCLDPSKTLRIICPTKSLSAHGYRFAYMLMPADMRLQFSHLYTNMYGPASLDSHIFSMVACGAIRSGEITEKVMDLAATRHKILRAEGAIDAPWEPEAGFFVFEQLRASLPKGTLLMDGSYFEQSRFEDYRRVNLLSSSIGLLSNKL